ncbi:pseudouridine synthase [Limisalsivibrio acetivorans]|uniref:pseudouridine synthase n=1 Tax=Limisalsivibrio acetivorans TaxID=1304888 RepID=UPI0003B6C0DE|nr:pseudouridine synthase [Limisalsivibrio acetivorans]
MRLSAKCAELFDFSRRRGKEFIKEGKISVNGKTVRKDIEIEGDEDIRAELDYRSEGNPAGEFIIKQNEQTLFLYKPPFMHTERHTPEDPPVLEDLVPEGYTLISRLDYETDGVIAAVRSGLSPKHIHKRYIAFVGGSFPTSLVMENRIDARKRRKVKVLDENGGNRTFFSLKDSHDGFSLISAELAHASRHQLRAYLAHVGFPILGDKLYGGADFPRMMLHCAYTEIDRDCADSSKEADFIEYFKTRAMI